MGNTFFKSSVEKFWGLLKNKWRKVKHCIEHYRQQQVNMDFLCSQYIFNEWIELQAVAYSDQNISFRPSTFQRPSRAMNWNQRVNVPRIRFDLLKYFTRKLNVIAQMTVVINGAKMAQISTWYRETRKNSLQLQNSNIFPRCNSKLGIKACPLHRKHKKEHLRLSLSVLL